jgi:hypothetical protein
MRIHNFYGYRTDWEALSAVEACGLNLKFVKNRTPEICKAAVMENTYALVWVKDQTEELCMLAVKQDGYALQWVDDQTYNVCYEAAKQNPDAVSFIRDKETFYKVAEALDIDVFY